MKNIKLNHPKQYDYISRDFDFSTEIEKEDINILLNIFSEKHKKNLNLMITEMERSYKIYIVLLHDILNDNNSVSFKKLNLELSKKEKNIINKLYDKYKFN